MSNQLKIIVALAKKISNDIATYRTEDSFKTLLALIKVDRQHELVTQSLALCAKHDRIECLKQVTATGSKLGLDLDDLGAFVTKHRLLFSGNYSEEDFDFFMSLSLKPEIALAVSTCWFPRHLESIVQILQPHINQDYYELDLMYAFACKELKWYRQAEALIKTWLSKTSVSVDKENKLRQLLSEIYLSTMRSDAAVQLLMEIKDDLDPAKTAQLLYSISHYASNVEIQVPIDAASAYEASLDMGRKHHDRFSKTKSSPTRGLLKVGFVSRSFKTHPVGWMISGLLVENLNDPQFQSYVFDLEQKDDFVAKTIRKVTGDGYQDCSKTSDMEILSHLRDSDLDIVIDLEGFSPDNKMHLYPSLNGPRLVKWIGGLVNSTHLSYFDALISDKYQSPNGTKVPYSESLYRMPDCYVTYTPPPYRISITAPPALYSEKVTFGSFNNVIKLNRKTIEVWAQILSKLDHAQLILKDRGFDSTDNQELVKRWFASEGISGERIQFIGSSDHQEQLALHNKVDIALDPIPYSGGLCTLEALSMGTPVITLAGKLICHRHSVTHLSNIGCQELIARDVADYISIALELAGNKQRLLTYSKTLRERLFKSPLLNHKKFLTDFSETLWEIKRSPKGYSKGGN